jgi:hypothetical protein
MGWEAMGRKPYSLLSIFPLSWGMKIKPMRIIYHTICLFRNPKAWRFYFAGIRREIF